MHNFSESSKSRTLAIPDIEE